MSGEEGEAIYNFSKHSASDDAGVAVFKVYQDLAPPQKLSIGSRRSTLAHS